MIIRRGNRLLSSAHRQEFSRFSLFQLFLFLFLIWCVFPGTLSAAGTGEKKGEADFEKVVAGTAITRAAYRASIDLDALLSADRFPLVVVDVTIAGRSVGRGWARTLIYPDTVPVHHFSGAADTFIDLKGGTFLNAKAPSEFEISFQIPTHLEPAGEGFSFKLPALQASVGRMHLTIVSRQHESFDITTSPAVPVSKQLHRGKWTFTFSPFPGTLQTMGFKPSVKTAAKPLYSVKQNISVFMAPGINETESRCVIQPRQSAVGELTLMTDTRTPLTGIVGDAIESWEERVLEGNRKIITVNLFSPCEKPFELTALFQMEPAATGTITIPAVRFPEAVKTSGTISVSTEKNYYTEEMSADGVERLSVQRDQIAYSFDTPVYTLALKLKPEPLKFDTYEEVLAELWPDMIRTIVRLKVTVMSGSLETCSIRVTDGFRCQSVTGDRVAGWTPKAGRINVNLGGLRDDATTVFMEGFSPLRPEERIRLSVPECLSVRNATGHLGIRVLGHLIPELDKAVNLFQTSKSNLPSWMKNTTLAFRFNGTAVSGTLSMVEPTPAVDVTSVTLLEITNTNLVFETRARVAVHQAPLFFMNMSIDKNEELDEISGPMVADWEKDPSGAITIRFTRPLAPGQEQEVSIFTLRPRQEVANTVIALPHYPEARHHEGYVVAKSRIESRISWKRTGKATECSPNDLPFKWFNISKGDHLLSYRKKTGVTLATRPIPLIFDQNSETVFTVSPALVTASSRVTLDVKQGAIKTITMKLPRGASNPDIHSHFLSRVQARGDAWSIDFSSILKGKTTLTVDYTIPFDPAAGFINLAPPEMSGRSRHTGALGYKSTSDIELTESFDGMDGLSHWKGSVPPDLKDVHSLYSLSSSGSPGLKLLLSKVQHQEKQKAEIKELTLTTLMESDSAVLTSLTARVDNPGNKQFLKIWLPGDTELWGVYIEGKPVKASLEAGSDSASTTPQSSTAPHAYTISLTREKGVTAFPLQVIYRQSGTSPVKTAAKVLFKAPRLDVPVGKVSWEVQIPEGFRLMMPGGNMQLVKQPQLESPGTGDIFIESLSRVLAWATPYFRAVFYLFSRALIILFWLALITTVIYFGYKILAWIIKVLLKVELKPVFGFTFKLLFFLGFIGFLVALGLPQFASMSEDAKTAKAKQDIDVLVGALTRYNAMEPRKAESLDELRGKYMVKLPVDPWGGDYYIDPGRGAVGSDGEDGRPGSADDVYISYLPGSYYDEQLGYSVPDDQPPTEVAEKSSIFDKLKDIEMPAIGPQFNRARTQARGKACLANIRVLEGAIDMWEMDTDGMTMHSGVIVHSNGSAGPVGKPLTPNYIKKLPRCRMQGRYAYYAPSHLVWCNRHNTVDHPTDGATVVRGPAGAGAAGGGEVAMADLEDEEGGWGDLLPGLASKEEAERSSPFEPLVSQKPRMPRSTRPSREAKQATPRKKMPSQRPEQSRTNVAEAEHTLANVKNRALSGAMDEKELKENIRMLEQARDRLASALDVESDGSLPGSGARDALKKGQTIRRDIEKTIHQQKTRVSDLEARESQKKMEQAARLVQEQKYDRAIEIYQNLKSTPAGKQASAALENAMKMQKDRVQKKGKKKQTAQEEETRRKVGEIQKLYIDRALAQAAVTRFEGTKDDHRRSETNRLALQKLDQAESQLLELPDTTERSQSLNEINRARRQIRGLPQISRVRIHGQQLQQPSDTAQLPTQAPSTAQLQASGDGFSDDDLGMDYEVDEEQFDMADLTDQTTAEKPEAGPAEELGPIVLESGDLSALGIPQDTIASGRAADEVRTTLHKAGLHQARVMEYGGKLVVIGAPEARSVLEDMKASSRRVSEKPQQQLLLSESPAEEPVAPPVPQPSMPEIQTAQANLLSSINRGLSRGALPLNIELPSSKIAYVFARGRAGHTVPEISFRFFPRNSVYGWSVGMAGLFFLYIGFILRKRGKAVMHELKQEKEEVEQ